MDDSYRSSSSTRRRRGRGSRALLLVLLATVALLTAACGGGSKDPGVASGPGTTTTAPPGSSSTTFATPSSTTTTTAPPGSPASGSSGQSSQSEQLQFSRCMRAHGEPTFPDPTPGGFLRAISASGIDTRSPTYHAALQACKQYTPAGRMTPAERAAANARGLEFSQCMRVHGVSNYPDPSTGPAGEQVIDLRGLGIDPSSPAYQAASDACQKAVPGSK